MMINAVGREIPEHIDGYGSSYVGTKGYCILSVIANKNALKLSGDATAISNALANIYNYPKPSKMYMLKQVYMNKNSSHLSNLLYSIELGSWSEALFSRVLSIDANMSDISSTVVVLESMSNEIKQLSSFSEEQCKDRWEHGENALYVMGYPEIGNQETKIANSNFA